MRSLHARNSMQHEASRGATGEGPAHGLGFGVVRLWQLIRVLARLPGRGRTSSDLVAFPRASNPRPSSAKLRTNRNGGGAS